MRFAQAHDRIRDRFPNKQDGFMRGAQIDKHLRAGAPGQQGYRLRW